MSNTRRFFMIRQKIENLPNGGQVFALNVVEHFPITANILDKQDKRYSKRVWFMDTFPLGKSYMTITAGQWAEFLKGFDSVYQIVMDRIVTDNDLNILEHTILLNYIDGKDVPVVSETKEESFS